MMAQRVRREGSEGAERSRGDLGRCGQRGVLASARGLHSKSHQKKPFSCVLLCHALLKRYRPDFVTLTTTCFRLR